MFVVAVVPYLVGMLRVGVPILSSDVDVSRAQFFVPIIGHLAIFLPVTTIIACRNRQRGQIVLSILSNLFFNFILISKMSILLYFLVLFYCAVKYQKLKLSSFYGLVLPLFVPLLVIALFSLSFDFRGSGDQFDYYWRSQIYIPGFDAFGDWLYPVYMYFTTPWSNFLYVVELEQELTFGVQTGQAVLNAFQLDAFFKIEPMPIRSMPYNTHAFPSVFYSDFGGFGAILISGILAYLVKVVYRRALDVDDPLVDTLWIYWGYATFMLFFSNHFSGVGYPVICLILFSAYSVCSAVVRRALSR